MPNWCTNYVTIRHDDKQAILDLQATIEQSQQAKEFSAGFFNQILPMPEELMDNELTTYGGSEDEQTARVIKQKTMIEKYGFPSWYDWRIETWGTKWDVREIGVFEINEPDQTIELQFDTAWSPPLGVYEALMDKGFYIRAEYVDECMGFVGEWIDGEDNCFASPEETPEHLSHLWPVFEENEEVA